MKKLVKSAKQQFEERIDSLHRLHVKECGADLFFACIDANNGFYLMIEAGEEDSRKFSEIRFDQRLCDIYESEVFLYNMIHELIECRGVVKPLFDWYASADKDNTPFDYYNLINCCDFERITFEDIYEDVPDAIVITAEQRWNEASKDARLIPSCSGCICKVEDNDEFLAFHINENNSYETMFFPSMKKLREDADFVRYYTNEVLQTHPEDIMYAIEWIGGGEYTMSDVTLWDIKIAYLNAYEKPFDHHIYVDSEEAPESDESEQNKGVDTTDLFEEYRSLHNKTFERVVNAHKDGLNITLDDIVQLDTLFYNDGSYVLICNLDSATICKNANNEYELELRDGRDTFGGFLKDLTLDTLLSILSKMH